MFRTRMTWIIVGVLALSAIAGAALAQETTSCKVLVVMSYRLDYPWTAEIKEGVDLALADTCELTYFYMDTKIDAKGGPQKAEEAYALYQELQPDGVIAADDNAQSMFVLPYLKDKVDTPVIFCGVNDEAGKYGYPASNVSGIVERLHIRESLAFIQQLVPSVTTFGYIVVDSASGKAVLNQIEGEAGSYPLTFTAAKLAKTLEEALAMTAELKEQADVLFMETLTGVTDENGNALTDAEVVPVITQAFGKPTTSNHAFNMQYGILGAIVKTGQEQGRVSAEMLMKAMQGTPVSDIPVTQNQYGRRMLNVTAAKALKIKPNRKALIGTELLKTVK